ncbi:MFS transporter [Microlunatus soli]|uniref:MFS transporter n=1 Tax=Microlunatus soli TaxID=630515 RepID=UPI001E5E1E84|nr:MFS transporter [Microlunatus soli]
MKIARNDGPAAGVGNRRTSAPARPIAWTGHARGSSGYRRILIALGAAGVATFAQLYSPQGILPLIGRSLRADAAQAALTVSAATLGLAVSVLGWAWVADRIGRARAMKIALSAAALIGLATPLAPSFAVLVVLRVAVGVALGGVPALAVAYLHEEVHRDQAPIAAGSYVSGTTIGGLLGRLVAAPFADLGGWRLGVGAVAVLAAIAALVFLLSVPAARGFVPDRRHRGTIRDAAAALTRCFRNPGLLVLYAQAFLLMGGFVATYNFLGYRLEGAPFDIPVSLTALIFLAYLAGTVSSRRAGALAARFGRRPVLLCCIATMIIGIGLTIPDRLPLILIGLLIMTAGFFGAHATAAGWVGARASVAKAQATSLYNLFYYAGSSLFGWLGGLAFVVGWTGTAVMVLALTVAALIIALLAARD